MPIIQVLDGTTLSPPVAGIQPLTVPADVDWAELIASLDALKAQVAEEWTKHKATQAPPNREARRANGVKKAAVSANGKST